MRFGARIALLVSLVAVASGAPLAIHALIGPTAAVVAALVAAGSLFAFVLHAYERPLAPLADLAGEETGSDGSTEELVRRVAARLRAMTVELDRRVSDDRRRELAFDHTTDGIVFVDPDGQIDYANHAARTLFLSDRLLESTRRLSSELDAVAQDARTAGRPQTIELTLRVPGPQHVLVRAVPDTRDGCLLIVSDLSEAHRVDRVRRDFVVNVSHELKTPAAGIRALAEVAAGALEERNHETAQRFVDRLQVEAERLGKLVVDLLDLSRVEAGDELDRRAVDLRVLVEEAADRARPLAEAKGLELVVSGSSVVVEADAAQLGMAAQNLIDNAVRYSDSGTVRVEVATRGEKIAIVVSDEGIGIPSDEVARIFERFYRVDRARSRQTGGTGLGLSIVRHVVENHGGRVEVASELGDGSTFTLLLPGGSHPSKGEVA